MAETLKLTPSESVSIVESTPERLVVEATYGPGGKPPPKHFHPRQSERFTVSSGRLRFRVAGDDRVLGGSEEIEIPVGVAHQVWNPHDEPATVTWVTSPAGRTEAWFRAVDAANRKAGGDRQPGLLAFAPLLSEYRDTFRLAGPDLLLGPLVAGLGAAGRLLGRKPN
jgi:mannose-6-phosphate isomerase-like protein (cupin superfamily)